jgi:hypothetical protein
LANQIQNQTPMVSNQQPINSQTPQFDNAKSKIKQNTNVKSTIKNPKIEKNELNQNINNQNTNMNNLNSNTKEFKDLSTYQEMKLQIVNFQNQILKFKKVYLINNNL